MRFPKVTKFLCCIDLQIGAYFIGAFGICLSLWELLYEYRLIGNMYRVTKLLAGGKVRKEVNPAYVLLLVNALWIYGVRVKKTGFLVTLMLLGVIVIIYETIYPFLVIWLVNLRPESETARDYSDQNFLITESLLYIAEYIVLIYFLIVEFSFYLDVKDAEDGQIPVLVPMY